MMIFTLIEQPWPLICILTDEYLINTLGVSMLNVFSALITIVIFPLNFAMADSFMLVQVPSISTGGPNSERCKITENKVEENISGPACKRMSGEKTLSDVTKTGETGVFFEYLCKPNQLALREEQSKTPFCENQKHFELNNCHIIDYHDTSTLEPMNNEIAIITNHAECAFSYMDLKCDNMARAQGKFGLYTQVTQSQTINNDYSKFTTHCYMSDTENNETINPQLVFKGPFDYSDYLSDDTYHTFPNGIKIGPPKNADVDFGFHISIPFNTRKSVEEAGQ